MAITYGTIERQAHNLLGNVKGADIATVETNYAAASSAANRLNPDFAVTPVHDSLLSAISDIVRAICETPRHPERKGFISLTPTLANQAQLPRANAAGAIFIGVMGRVYDATDQQTCLAAPLDDIRKFNEFAGTIYASWNPYWYALSGNAIEHTRTAGVIIEWPVYARPAFVAAANIPLDDYHEYPLICGAVCHLAPKEGMYLDLFNACKGTWEAHLGGIRAVASPALQTEAASAPAT